MMLKSRFFKKQQKSQQLTAKPRIIPHSASCDSSLSGFQQQQKQQQQHKSSFSTAATVNNSIDKPGLKPIGELPPSPVCSFTTPPVAGAHHHHPHHHLPLPPAPSAPRHHNLAMLHSSLCQLSPIPGSQCSSTQRVTGGVTNELFDAGTTTTTAMGLWGGGADFPTEMRLFGGVEGRKEGRRQRRFGNANIPDSPNCTALVKCTGRSEQQEQQQLWTAGEMMNNSPAAGRGNQVADLVFTLAQQLTGKDTEIGKLRDKLKKSECRAERMFREFERDLERKNDELEASREELSRMRKKLRLYETEMETNNNRLMQDRHQQKMQEEEEQRRQLDLETEMDKLMAENAQLKARNVQQMQEQRKREAEWEVERKELNQSVKLLNGTLEELELRQREGREREMHLELLERAMVARMQLDNNNRREMAQEGTTIGVPLLDLPSPKSAKTDSSFLLLEACPSSTTSNSSGVGSLLKDLPEHKELDTVLASAKRRLFECRTKIGHLLKSAEKLQKGERLGRADLFGHNLSMEEMVAAKCDQNVPTSPVSLLEEHVKLVSMLRTELELLHDKFTILYAKGAIGGL